MTPSVFKTLHDAGIMGFIYSDLMVPPLVQVNAGYYGWKMALYIAGVMYISIVITALILDGAFSLIDIVPEGRRAITEIAQFKLDYTFWMNLASVAIVAAMAVLKRRYAASHAHEGGQAHDMDHGGGLGGRKIMG